MADSNASPGSPPGLLTARSSLTIEFVGERHDIETGPFVIGSRAHLNLDVASAVPERLLELWTSDGVWLLRQLERGPRVSLHGGGWRADVSAVAAVPLVLAEHRIVIDAPPSSYEVELRMGRPLFVPAPGDDVRVIDDEPHVIPSGMSALGGEEVAPLDVGLNREQRVLLTALAAPVLRGGAGALSDIPSSVEAAHLLGWPVTKFNRKLDTVCAKLAKAGITGLHGGADRPALNRRTRLVQVVVAHGVVSGADLALLNEFSVPD